MSNEHGGGAEVQVEPRLPIKMNRHNGVEQNGDECQCLTRSLSDFAKIVDVLDAHNASFELFC